MLKNFLRYLLAVIVTAALATASSTQLVLAELATLGVAVPVGERLSMTAHDLLGMGPSFGALIAAGFAVALPLAAWLARRGEGFRTGLFVLAGAAALATILTLMRAVLGLTPIAGARTGAGFATLVACGAVGGLVFALTRRTKEATDA